MKVEIPCSEAPSLAQWVSVLVEEGWKIDRHGPDGIEAKHRLGQSRHPVKNATVWYLRIEESDGEIVLDVTVSVPAFADSVFSRMRILDEFADIADSVGGVETDRELAIDVLSELR